MHRVQLIQSWLEQIFDKQEFKINYLAGDASFRRYARIETIDKTYMLMDAPPEKENCLPFVQIASYLDNQHCRVPQIIQQDLKQGLLLLEDFGDQLLSTVLTAHTVDTWYTQAFKQIIQLQGISIEPTLFPQYSDEKLLTEMRLFDEWMLPSLGIQLSVQSTKTLNESYQWMLQNLKQQPQVIVHRDYHSRNLMVLQGTSELGIIDFQDAVVGPDTYDLISIIRDAYVQWPITQVHAWIEQFYAMLPDTQKQARDLTQFKLDCEIMSIQRHLKILGIFVRLYERDGKSGYLKDLPRVMWYLRQQLANCPPLLDLKNLIENEVITAFNAKYGLYQEVIA